MRPRFCKPFTIPMILLITSAYVLGVSPDLPGLAAVLSADLAAAPCGCTGEGCCGAGCCGDPAAAVLSCCETAAPAVQGPVWDAACTCGDRTHPGANLPGCDHHLPATATRSLPALAPTGHASPPFNRIHTPDLDDDDPVPRPPSGLHHC